MSRIRTAGVALTLGLALWGAGCGKRRAGEAQDVDPAVGELIRTLETGNYYRKCEAAKALAAEGAAARAAVPALVGLLGEFEAERRAKEEQPLVQVEGLGVVSADPPKVGEEAAKALTAIGEPAVAAVAGAVGSTQLGVRLRAAQVLGGIGPAAGAGVPALVTMLQRREYFQDREQAARALGRIGPAAREALAALAAALKDETFNVRDEAVKALAALGTKDAVGPLDELLRTGPTEVDRRTAAVALGRMGEAAAASAPAIVALLDRDADAQQFVGSALAGIGPAVVPTAVAELASKSGAHRWAAIEALRQLGPGAAPAVPALLGIVKDGHTRACVKRALAAVGAEAVPGLLEALPGAEPDVREDLFETLGAMGDAAAGALPQLAELARQGSERDRKAALATLCKVGGDAPVVFEALAAALKDKHFVVQCAAIEAFGALGTKGGRAVPDLVAVLADRDRRLRTAAARSLGKIGAAAVPGLVTALGDRRAAVREAAADALGEMGAAASGAVADVARATRDAEESVRYEAVQALGQIGKEPAVAVPALQAVLEADASMMVRCEAARVLGELGAAAAAAVPSLTRARDGTHGGLKGAAAEALRRIEAAGAR